MDASAFEEKELAYLRQSFTQHGISSFGRPDASNASPLYSWLAQQAALDQEIWQYARVMVVGFSSLSPLPLTQ
ncbi:hypothetical protein [Ktedonospora formicarum]|uniref:Uncharacterized protein n=1 Tax=Ktedonospora formicarum TaxID=2778364 RepID=A0A8J3I3N6_9CHLR|nr:hypothetical protein [Ktedonospora formicarum]GHO49577.1 hypothetical protein KSX_77400 [Ktedonospora formicarum]